MVIQRGSTERATMVRHAQATRRHAMAATLLGARSKTLERNKEP